MRASTVRDGGNGIHIKTGVLMVFRSVAVFHGVGRFTVEDELSVVFNLVITVILVRIEGYLPSKAIRS